MIGPDFNTEENLHADAVAERYDSEQEDRECHCGRIMSLREATEQHACNDCAA